jgi:hypothetical protein
VWKWKNPGMETPDRFMNTEKTETSEPSDIPQAIDTPVRAMPGRKIDAVTIAEMAKLCAKMLTESEACRRLGIKPRTWFDFKSRAGRTQRFADLLEAYRAGRIEGLIDRIENSADGVGVKFPDWRAALALLKITDQRRFGDSPTVEINATHQTAIVLAAGGEDKLRKLVASYCKLAKLPVFEPPASPKQIRDAGAVDVKTVK